MTATAPPPTRSRSWSTLWYYLVIVGTLGFLSAVPFAHAATRLRGRPAALWCTVSAVLYAAAIVVAIVATTGPRDPADRTGGTIAIVTMLVAVVHVTFVRRQVAAPRWP